MSSLGSFGRSVPPTAVPPAAEAGDVQWSIKVDEVYKWFYSAKQRVEAIAGTTFVVADGSFVALIGPSGCGKSTILNCVAGLISPNRGMVSVRGQRVDGPTPGLGYMTQRDALLPWRRVIDNVALPLQFRGVGRPEREERARDWLIRVGLSDFQHLYPRELSGGMVKRVALARTMVCEPHTILMDEPFGNLDAQMRLQLQSELVALWEGARKSVLFVTHDIDEAIALSDEIVVLSPMPSRVVSVVPVPLARPRNAIRGRLDPEFGRLREHVYQLSGLLG